MGSAFLKEPITTKKIEKYQHRKLRAICCQMQGWRTNMEDAKIFDRINKDVFLIGVFDGHGGVEVAEYCSKQFSKQLQNNNYFQKGQYSKALEETFMLMDQLIDTQQGQRQLRNITVRNGLQLFQQGKVAESVGCTANVILIVQNVIYAANAGDSRAALCRKGAVVPLSIDHKPDDQIQKNRITKAGCLIDKGRINGHLNLSRSIGDLHYKRNNTLPLHQQAVTSKPDIKILQMSKEDQFIILGCDGVWERYQNNSQEFIDFIRQQRFKGKDPQNVLEEYFDRSLAKDPSQQIGCDNMTAILVQFNKLML